MSQQLKMPRKPIPDWEAVRDEWVRTVEQLVTDVESWCRANDWPTRRIGKRDSESPVGEYVVPALLVQADLVKLMLEPVARFAAGTDGVVDLYRMPQYDDVASICRRNGAWEVQYPFASAPDPDAGDPGSAPPKPFTSQEFTAAVRAMVGDA